MYEMKCHCHFTQVNMQLMKFIQSKIVLFQCERGLFHKRRGYGVSGCVWLCISQETVRVTVLSGW